MSAGMRRVSEPLLECYLVGSLDAEARARVEAVLAESEVDRARLEELRAESAAFLVQRPPGPFVERVQASQRPWWRKSLVLFAPVLAATALALVVFLPAELPSMHGSVGAPDSENGASGLHVTEVSLEVYRESKEERAWVEPGETLSPGEPLRFKVRAQGKRGYVAVLSRDSAGAVSVYHPFGGKAAAPFDSKDPLLPVDVSAGWKEREEVLFALFSQEPFELDWAVSALGEDRDLARAAPVRMAVGRTSFRVRDSRDRSMLVVFRKHGESLVRVYRDEILSPGDTLRFEVRTGEKRGFVAALSRDAAGAVSVYHPFGGKAAAPFDSKLPLLPGSMGMGGRMGREDVYVLFSSQPFKLDWAVSALREGRELEHAAPKGLVVGHTSFRVLDLKDRSLQEHSSVEKAFTMGSPVAEISLGVYLKRAEGVAYVMPGETLSPRDTLRIEVRAQGLHGYVAVLRRNAAGTVTVYHPSRAHVAAPFDSKAPLLPGAFELGGGEGKEEVYALFSLRPFELDWAVSALREGRELADSAPKGVAVGDSSFMVRGARPMEGTPL